MARAVARLGATSARVAGFAGDLGGQASCAELVAAHPDFDIVGNNLGVLGPQDFFDTPDSEWQRFFETNVLSGVRLARAYAPSMVERGWGRIVFISSESALNIPGDMIHYGFTKTGQLAVPSGLAKRLAGTGVTANAVLPRPTLSEGVAGMLKAEVERSGNSLEGGGAHDPLRQFGTGFRHDRRRAARRWRRGRQHRLAAARQRLPPSHPTGPPPRSAVRPSAPAR